MGRNGTTISKEFFLGAEWNLETAERIDHMLEEIAQNTPAVRKGRYFGNGIAQTIAVGDLPETPLLAILQPSLGGIPFITMTPYLAGAITAWNRSGFTLSASGAYNTPLTSYFYLVVA